MGKIGNQGSTSSCFASIICPSKFEVIAKPDPGTVPDIVKCDGGEVRQIVSTQVNSREAAVREVVGTARREGYFEL